MVRVPVGLLSLLVLTANGDRMKLNLQSPTPAAPPPAPTPAPPVRKVFNLPINKGKKLTVQLAAWKIGGMIQVQYGSEGDMGLTVHFKEDGTDKYIERSGGAIGKGTLTPLDRWGGWPLGPASRASKWEFVLTKTSWEVSLDGKRVPWYDRLVPDYQRASLNFPAIILTDLDTGGVDPTVTDRVCDTTCFECERNAVDCSDECDKDGHQTIKAKIDGYCTPGGAGDEGSCCLGFSNTYTIDTATAGSAAVIVANDEYLSRTCESADLGSLKSGDDTPDMSLCDTIKKQRAYNSRDGGALRPDTKLVILGRELAENGDWTGRVLTYFTESHAKLMVSPWLLVPIQTADHRYTLTGGPWITLIEGTGQAEDIDYARRGESPPKFPKNTDNENEYEWFKFATRLKQNGKLYQFTPARLAAFAGSGTEYSITLSDTPRLAVESDCKDKAGWRDGQGDPKGCARYGGSDKVQAWCTKFGKTTEAWKTGPCSGFSCEFSAFAVGGVSAADACCACGGGEPKPIPGEIDANA